MLSINKNFKILKNSNNVIISSFTTSTPTQNNNNNVKRNKYINVFRSKMFIPFQDQKMETDLIESQLLMQKGGLIRKLAVGSYSTLPFAQKALENLIKVIDEEMEQVGGQKMTMPKMIPKELWDKTGRWDAFGKDLIKLKDRRENEYCMGPTHEEVVTSIVGNEKLPFNNFPIKLYQIGEKFRDEIRPRFGLLRGKEFLMKDMYSFDVTKEDAEKTYYQVKQAYHNILDRLELPYACVEADSGNIGGNMSHEFQVVTKAGEDKLIHCSNCGYHANIEKAVGLKSKENINDTFDPIFNIVRIETNQKKNNKHIAIVVNDSQDTFNHYSIKKHYNNIKSIEPITKNQYTDLLSKHNSKENGELNYQIFVDTNASKPFSKNQDALLEQIKSEFSINLNKDHKIIDSDILIEAKEGDICAQESCNGSSKLGIKKGIEVGHIFYLGNKYSSSFNATSCKNNIVKDLEMGCFGIGVSRLLAASVEALSKSGKEIDGTVTKDKITFPKEITPYHIIIVPKKESLQKDAEEISQQLQQQIPELKGRIIIDDRHDANVGHKIFESKFLGIPYLLVLNIDKSKQTNYKVEYDYGQIKEENNYLNQPDTLDYFKNKFI
ncbi:hypothetical protein DICPUDRAFT_74994 [Dictyostelium purpureum]|uniref:proline--tRNA ligase n=1 Tax=Dictyostelium purpureum TaxID=5786 RepID=F0Z9C0_DICPU|nr:uncharacterized protein DICPUDRAFT_74994 [Dictyostelium purpureum]EGC39475.1 hypothetical protein DICPUDRAFT_74994 [Dictyostelium purpureum]|eukprot:XP_003284033.1 hypothetical protein DICPUDRAFT_74994 [Dictyostelium purpureum]